MAVDPVSAWLISPAAAHDIESILAWSEERFGERTRRRYEALIVRAIRDVAENPDRPGSQRRWEVAGQARTYHLLGSRDRVTPAIDRVRRPRHFRLYRVRDDGRIEVGRVLHESMDLRRHLPEGYLP